MWIGDVIREARKKLRESLELKSILFVGWLLVCSARKSEVLLRDFFTIDLSDANVIFIFQYNNVNEKLYEKFKKELKPGTRIISYYWKI